MNLKIEAPMKVSQVSLHERIFPVFFTGFPFCISHDQKMSFFILPSFLCLQLIRRIQIFIKYTPALLLMRSLCMLFFHFCYTHEQRMSGFVCGYFTTIFLYYIFPPSNRYSVISRFCWWEGEDVADLEALSEGCFHCDKALI